MINNKAKYTKSIEKLRVKIKLQFMKKVKAYYSNPETFARNVKTRGQKDCFKNFAFG